MRSIVAVGVATFVACCLTATSWAEETTPCKQGKCAEGKCAEAKAAACCPACPADKAAVATEGCSAKACQSCQCTAKVAGTVATSCGKKECAKGECASGKCAAGQCGETKCLTSKCTKCTGQCSECAPWEATAVAAAPIALATANASDVGAIRAVATVKAPSSEPRRYTVKMRMTEGGREKDLAAPTICVDEGASASVKSGSSRPFVTGVRKSHEGMAQPIITVLDEGTTIEVRVTPLANRRVQLDATIEQTTIDADKEVESPFQTEEERETLQAPEVSSQSRRVVRAVELGETVKLQCGCACDSNGEQGTVVLLTVDQVGAPTPGITPITKVTATEEIKEGELYHMVYPVGDLLEPYAVHKEGAAVEAADFLPIIDMLLTEAGCDWPADAKINPYEENQTVVIAQTKAGHEAIAKYLARKRASVAEIEANLLRK